MITKGRRSLSFLFVKIRVIRGLLIHSMSRLPPYSWTNLVDEMFALIERRGVTVDSE